MFLALERCVRCSVGCIARSIDSIAVLNMCGITVCTGLYLDAASLAGFDRVCELPGYPSHRLLRGVLLYCMSGCPLC